MHFISYRTGILSVVTVLLFHGGTVVPHRDAPDNLKNRPELSLPLTDKKLVIAHCMTDIIRYKGHKLEDSCNPDYYSPDNNPSSSLGGLTQVKVMAEPYLANASLDEAVEFEMRAAKKSGIDGFQFYYTLGNDSWDNIIRAYFRVAEQKHIDFYFTFCISHPAGGDEASRIQRFATRMKSILDEVGHNNPHWLRTPDGRLIIYTWYGDNLADVPAELYGRPAQYYVANAFRKLADAVQENFACVISINEQITQEKLNNYLDYFPAVWIWTLPYNDHYIGNLVARECQRRKRTFTGSAFPDFYTSKLLKKGTWDMYHFVDEAVSAGLQHTERKYIVTGLSYNFRKLLEFGMSKNISIMNIITWNDYPEGHHLAPEINHNDGFSLLLNYYKQKWENTAPDENDIVIAFYKKYKHAISPSPFNIPVVDIERPGIAETTEDSIEIVTILKEKSELHVNNQQATVPAGLQSTRFASLPGPVTVSLYRDQQMITRFTCPEWITDKPYRTDRLTYTFSNRSDSDLQELLGHLPPRSEEYNAGASDNHIGLYRSP